MRAYADGERLNLAQQPIKWHRTLFDHENTVAACALQSGSPPANQHCMALTNIPLLGAAPHHKFELQAQMQGLPQATIMSASG
jgi:hypothetical protein